MVEVRQLSVVAVAAAMLSCQPAQSTKLSAVTQRPQVSVVDYGAKGDGITDDRVAIQAALDAGAGGQVMVPRGRYLVGRAPGTFWCLTAPAGTTITGDSDDSVIVQAPVPGSVKLLEVDTQGVSLRDIHLAGAAASQPDMDEHRAGVFVRAAGLTVDHVLIDDFTGDSISLYTGADGATITNSRLLANGRDGLSIVGALKGLSVRDSIIAGSAAQQIDAEPGQNGVIADVSLTRVSLSPGPGGDFVLAIAGGSPALRTTGWSVRDSVMDGAWSVVWAEDIEIRGCRGVSASPHASRIYRSSDRVTVADSQFSSSSAPSIIEVAGTSGVVEGPDHVTLQRLSLRAIGRPAMGVHVISAVRVAVLDNEIRGSGIAAPFDTGVLARAAVPARDMLSVVVRGNRISGFGALGVGVTSSPGVVRLADVSDNVFEDSIGGPMRSAMYLDARDARQRGNLALGGCVSLMASSPVGVRQEWGDGDRWLRSDP